MVWKSRANQGRGYCIIGRNYDSEQPDRVLQEFEDTICGQDQRIVESQRPEQVPCDLASELHLKFDALSIAYRRVTKAVAAFRERGLRVGSSTAWEMSEPVLDEIQARVSRGEKP